MSNQSFTRINTLELKALIVKRIGHRKAEIYFNHLTRFFSSKITKPEFNNLCIKIIGRENIPLHNQLVKSILKNATLAKSAPPRRLETNHNAKTPNGYQRNAFPPSPKKGRSQITQNRKFTDRPSPLGPLGKPQSIICESATELLSLGSRPPIEVVSVEEGEEVEQESGSLGGQSQSPVTAPLGVSLVGSRKNISHLLTGGGHFRDTCQNDGFLPDTRMLRSRMERRLGTEGLSVSEDCVNLVNNALDVYLKRLIEPSIGLASSRRKGSHLRRVNDRWIMPGSNIVSTVDFNAAMELNPRILGDDWPTILEKVSSRVHGE